MNYRQFAAVSIIAMTLIASAMAYAWLPESLVSHWDASGIANGAMPRLWGVLLTPFLMLAVLGLFRFLPRYDPLIKQNLPDMQVPIDIFTVMFMLFFAYAQGLILAWNLGYKMDMVFWLLPALSALFYAIGSLLPTLKRNYSFGIRTPWTVSDDAVWVRTHESAGPAFRVAALLMLYGLVLPDYAMWCILVPIVIATLFAVARSFMLYQALHHANPGK